MFQKLYMLMLKRAIIKTAQKSGCDIDGDIVLYKNKRYYVHCMHGIVEQIREINTSYYEKLL